MTERRNSEIHLFVSNMQPLKFLNMRISLILESGVVFRFQLIVALGSEGCNSAAGCSDDTKVTENVLVLDIKAQTNNQALKMVSDVYIFFGVVNVFITMKW